MAIIDNIKKDLIEAQKSGDRFKVNCLRFFLSALKNREIELRRELTDEDVVEVAQRLAKQRRESIEGFKRGGRTDLVEKEEKELAILKEYLPEELSEEEIKRLAKECIEEVSATSKKDMGKVMKALMPKVKGRADGKLVQRIVVGLLEG